MITDRESFLLDFSVDFQDKLQRLKEELNAEGVSRDPALWSMALNPLIDLLHDRDFSQSEQKPYLLHIRQYFGNDLYFYAIARLRELGAKNGHHCQPDAGDFVSAAHYVTNDPPPIDPILIGLFETADKIAVLGPSKVRKSFFVMQMALNLAAGRDFFGYSCPMARSVAYVQKELKSNHVWRRIHGMARGLNIQAELIEKNCHILNARGRNIDYDWLINRAKQHSFDVIILDPLYKLLEGDENSAQDMKPILAEFDRLMEETGAAVVYVHHDRKGEAGIQDIRDRGAGSNVLGRDYDTCITLTQHDSEDQNLAVIELLCRNTKIKEPFTAKWNDDRKIFEACDVPAIPRVKGRSGRPRRNQARDAAYVLAEIRASGIGIDQKILIENLSDYIGEKHLRGIIKNLANGGQISIEAREHNHHFIAANVSD